MTHTLILAFAASVALAMVIVLIAQSSPNRYLCKVLGHQWDIEPPWSGKEIRHNPHCERCGHEPDQVAIIGSHEGDHRV